MSVRPMHDYEEDRLRYLMSVHDAAFPIIVSEDKTIHVQEMKMDTDHNRIILKILTANSDGTSRREEMPMSRVMTRKKLNRDFFRWPTAQTIAEWGRQLMSLDGSHYRLDVFKGTDIPDAYTKKNGLGISSCMTGVGGDPFVEFYNDPDVRLVGLYNTVEERYTARALLWLWHDDKVVMRDRVYFRQSIDNDRMKMMVQKLIDEDWGWRGYCRLTDTEKYNLPLLRMAKGPDGSIPYFDTMEYAEYDCDDVVVHPVADRLTDEGYSLEDPCCDGGPFFRYDEDYPSCEDCDDRVHNDDMYVTAYGYSICERCADGYITADPYGDLYLPDDVVETVGGGYWSIDHLDSDMVIGEGPCGNEVAMPIDDSHEYDGVFYHVDHPDIVRTDDGDILHKDEAEEQETVDA